MDRLPLIVLEGPPGAAEREASRLRLTGLRGRRRLPDAPSRAAGPSCARVRLPAQSRPPTPCWRRSTGPASSSRRRQIGRRSTASSTTSGASGRWIIGSVAEEPAQTLDPEGRAILALLAEGLRWARRRPSSALPRRTADRRLAAARRALGTERTAEALARARRLGWLG